MSVASPASAGVAAASSSSSTSTVSPAILPAPTATAMPSHMVYASLEWLASASGAPRPVSETPPTSPAKHSPVGRVGGAETPEARRERQAAFLREKNREVAELRQRAQNAATTLVAEVAEGVPPASPSPASLTTPKKATASSAASVTSPESLVSPEKRRAKKLAALQYPLFSVHWWDVVQSSPADGEPASLGLLLLGGGGGKKGSGIDSGLLVCGVLPSSCRALQSSASPVRMSSASHAGLGLDARAFLDSNDFLIGSVLPHPRDPVLAATVGAGTALLQAEGAEESSALTMHYAHAVQTDFHKDLNAQAQAWAPSGRWLVTGGEDRAMRVWSYPDLTLVGVLSGNKLGLDATQEQHRYGILSLHVNHDGTRVVSCAGDGHVKIWNTAKLEGIDEDEEDEEGAEKAAAASSSSSSSSSLRVVECPLVSNLTIPCMKGGILKFSAARFCGKKRLTPRRSRQRTTLEGDAAASANVRRPRTVPPVVKEEGEEAGEDEEVLESESDSEEEDDDDVDTAFPASLASEYVVAIASQLKRGGGASSLVKFALEEGGTPVRQASTGSAALTTMEVSDDIRRPFVALANTDGLVAIYDADTMRCVKKVPKCHESDPTPPPRTHIEQ